MSGYQRPNVPGVQTRLQLPRMRAAGTIGETYNAAATILESSDQSVIHAFSEPTFPAVILTTPLGRSFRVTVSETGVLSATPIFSRDPSTTRRGS